MKKINSDLMRVWRIIDRGRVTFGDITRLTDYQETSVNLRVQKLAELGFVRVVKKGLSNKILIECIVKPPRIEFKNVLSHQIW